MPNAVDFPVFDADNHYYEALDAFTRHLDPAMRKRGDAVGDDRRQAAAPRRRPGQPLHPEPDVRSVSKPGALSEYFRAKSGVGDMRAAFGELDPMDDRPEYRNRDARLEVMDEQGLEACLMLPTLGVGMETALEHDPAALNAAFRVFNRWLDEDWGFNYQDRIYAAPYVTLLDVDWAVEELEYALAHDARHRAHASGSVTVAERAARRAIPRTTRSGPDSTRPASRSRPRRRLRVRPLRAALGPQPARPRRSATRRSACCRRARSTT